MKDISWSKKFKQKFLSIIPYINKQYETDRKRLNLIESAKELPSPKPRLATKWTRLGTQKKYRDLYNDNELFCFEIANTNSMEPVMDAGHKLICRRVNTGKPYNTEDIVPGDIICFRRWDGSDVVHRVTEVKRDPYRGEIFLTLGDNVVISDGYTQKNNVHYIVVAVIY